MVGTIAIAIAMVLTIPIPNHSKTDFLNIRYWDGIWYSKFGFPAPTLYQGRGIGVLVGKKRVSLGNKLN